MSKKKKFTVRKSGWFEDGDTIIESQDSGERYSVRDAHWYEDGDRVIEEMDRNTFRDPPKSYQSSNSTSSNPTSDNPNPLMYSLKGSEKVLDKYDRTFWIPPDESFQTFLIGGAQTLVCFQIAILPAIILYLDSTMISSVSWLIENVYYLVSIVFFVVGGIIFKTEGKYNRSRENIIGKIMSAEFDIVILRHLGVDKLFLWDLKKIKYHCCPVKNAET